MLNARGVYRKVTRKVFDFSPEQLASLTSVIWLHRGHSERFVTLVADHLANAVQADKEALTLLSAFSDALDDARAVVAPLFKNRTSDIVTEFDKLVQRGAADMDIFAKATSDVVKAWSQAKRDNDALKAAAKTIVAQGERGHSLAKEIDHITKLFSRLTEAAESENARATRDVKQAAKKLDETREAATTALSHIRYFARHAQWLQDRFPNAKLRDVEGLVKLVDFKELEDHDWSLTPGRYVGVAPEEEDEDFDFEDAMREIHGELADLTAEATEIADRIAKNFEASLRANNSETSTPREFRP